ncbi:ATP-binding protein [Dictyobacter kobayashii]|uniref:histidine kinase n=1 Tax=Dictyobacter kobayashii TaxID=2014872 RepID=A0A402AKK8_9CHLR|nr:ATP-binding protein [Dictyobacter kobayashii]GCE19768.1 hypothetical protein KDK_35680 [Dictyobacter kobayashii]
MLNLQPSLLLISRPGRRWSQYTRDSALAIGSILPLTAVIFFFNLAERIPNCLLLYLIVIMALACTRGLFAALVASILAFFTFDFLFVPPIYSFLTAKYNDVLGLIVFLITAINTSQLTALLRMRVEQSRQRERETRILYNLVRATNLEEDMAQQLRIFMQAVTEVFADWGIHDCMLLLPDEEGILRPQGCAHQLLERVQFLPDEISMADYVLQHNSIVELYDPVLKPAELQIIDKPHQKRKRINSRCSIRLVPLAAGSEVVGVLRLLIMQEAQAPDINDLIQVEHSQTKEQAVFFSTFLEQAITAIKQGRLRRESVHLKVLQQTDALRSALLSSVSHDLRTPLSTIKTAATSLLQTDVEWDKEAQRSFITSIEHESDRLDALVENLLDMSRIEAGALHPEKVWYPIEDIIYDTLARMESLTSGRAINTTIPATLMPVEIDYMQIDQVISNLLENALRYTPAGTPIDIVVTEQEKELLITVADRGPGIGPHEQEKIFDKFYQIPGEQPATNTTSHGLGLGLAICRGIVEAHQGRIWVAAREGGGSCFYFTLPSGEFQERLMYEQTQDVYSSR